MLEISRQVSAVGKLQKAIRQERLPGADKMVRKTLPDTALVKIGQDFIRRSFPPSDEKVSEYVQQQANLGNTALVVGAMVEYPGSLVFTPLADKAELVARALDNAQRERTSPTNIIPREEDPRGISRMGVPETERARKIRGLVEVLKAGPLTEREARSRYQRRLSVRLREKISGSTAI